MKKMAIPLMMTLVLAAAAGQGPASVTYSPFLGLVNPAADEAGNPIADGTYLMVLDLDGDGYNPPSYMDQAVPPTDNYTTWEWDLDDHVLGRGPIVGGQAFPNVIIDPGSIPGYDAGVDPWFVLWFPVPFDALMPGPGPSVWYGAEPGGVAGANGDTLSPFLLGGPATLITTPEPATLVLLGIGGLGALFARRRSRGNA